MFVGRPPPTPADSSSLAFSLDPSYTFPSAAPRRSKEKAEVFGGRELVMDRKVVAVCVTAGFLGLLSMALALAAVETRIKLFDVQIVRGRCKFPKRPTLVLGLIP